MTDPPEDTQGSTSERTTLSRDLSDFLIEFSIALNKHAMYPGGHPSLEPAAERVIARLQPLLVSRGTLSLGVARNQLVIEGVATDPKNPVLSDLASRLHRHHLGAVSLRPGVDAAELRDMFTSLAVEADITGEPLGLGPPERLVQGAHVQLFPLTYDRLELIEEDGTRDTSEHRTRGAQLWVGLARAALAEGVGEDADESTDPSAVAAAIIEHPKTAAYDQVIVGYMLQIAEELRSTGGREAAELQQRMSKLVTNLDQPTMERLLEMGGDRGQRRKFMLDASQGMALDTVMDLMQAATRTEQYEDLSHSMLRMMQKLAQHAESGSSRRRSEADASMREQVAELIGEWSLNDPNPEAYRAALKQMAGARSVFSVSPEQRYAPEPRRILHMALEVGQVGESVTHAVDRLAESGELGWVLRTIQEVDSPVVSEGVWQHLATPETVRRVASHSPLETDTLDLLVPRMGLAAARPMLEALVESEDLQARSHLTDRIVRLGQEVGPLAVEWLEDERGHVQRNMLLIIAELPELPKGFQAADYAKNPDPQVRREAIRIMLKDPAGRERAICQALADPEENIVRIGLAGAQESCPDTAVPLVVSRVAKTGEPELRHLAIRALARSGHPLALETLLGIVRPTRRLFWTRLPRKTPEYLAALTGLWERRDDARVDRALAAAAKSKDPEVARAAGPVQEEP